MQNVGHPQVLIASADVLSRSFPATPSLPCVCVCVCVCVCGVCVMCDVCVCTHTRMSDHMTGWVGVDTPFSLRFDQLIPSKLKVFMPFLTRRRALNFQGIIETKEIVSS